jgi:outer membrane lipoprotein SlyB
MRAVPSASAGPSLRSGLPGILLLAAAATAWAQNLVIPDLRDPALYRDPPRAAATCRVCGEISSIREVRIQKDRNPAGGPVGGQLVFGAVILVPFGQSGAEQPYVGGVGTAEMAERLGNTTYEVTVRMDNGERQSVQLRDGASYRVGERVTVSGGMLARL